MNETCFVNVLNHLVLCSFIFIAMPSNFFFCRLKIQDVVFHPKTFLICLPDSLSYKHDQTKQIVAWDLAWPFVNGIVSL